MSDTQRFDPALLSQGKRDKKAQLNQLFGGKVLMQLLPKCLVSDSCVPDNRAGIGQRDLFPFRKLIRVGEVQQVIVFVLGQTLPSSLDGSLDASILTIDGL